MDQPASQSKGASLTSGEMKSDITTPVRTRPIVPLATPITPVEGNPLATCMHEGPPITQNSHWESLIPRRWAYITYHYNNFNFILFFIKKREKKKKRSWIHFMTLSIIDINLYLLFILIFLECAYILIQLILLLKAPVTVDKLTIYSSGSW